MSSFLIPVILVVAIGFVAAAVLAFASKVFAIEVDQTQVDIRAVLPGANCGGCGFAGCDDYASALASDHTTPCTRCVVGGAAVAEQIANILGVSAGAEEKEVAVVMCNGTSAAAKKLADYEDFKTCKAAKSICGGNKICQYGCLGLGDCNAACQFDAIHVRDGVAWVDRSKCTSCGACVRACPNHLIRLAPEKNLVFVRCSNKDKARDAMQACKNACIGCKKCENTCKFDAVHVTDNLSFIDPAKCKNCGMCEKVCPTGNIINMRLVMKAAKDKKEGKVVPPAPKQEPAQQSAQA
ncbi:MAG: RnfABCDGE type electron transport complex subunit B [Eubacteriales bacterium]|nr:RnfABCDGE type electron transport complex subunit B [Eubacteriales bacterium]